MKRNLSGSLIFGLFILLAIGAFYQGLLMAEPDSMIDAYFAAAPRVIHVSPESVKVEWDIFPSFNKTTHYQVQLNHALYGSSTKLTNHLLTGLQPGATYDMAVVTYDRGAAVGVSSPTRVLMAPAIPQMINVYYVGSASIGISWQKVDTAIGYRIFQEPDVLLQELTATETKVLLAGFEPGTLIKLRLASVNVTGQSNLSETIEVQLMPPPPEISVIENRIGADWFEIKWEAVIEAVSYSVLVNDELIASLSPDINTYRVEGLATGTAVSVKMTAENPFGNSEESAPIIIQLLPATPVLAVTDVSSFSATLQWSVANGAGNYKVYLNSEWAILNVPSTITNVTITENITAGMTATYTVRAGNGTGESAHSNAVVVTFTEEGAIVRQSGDLAFVKAASYEFDDKWLSQDVNEPTVMVLFPPELEGPSLAFEASYFAALASEPELQKVRFIGIFTGDTITIKGERPTGLKWKKFRGRKKVTIPGSLPMVRFYAADGILRNVVRVSMAIISPYDVFKDLPEIFEKSDNMQQLYQEDQKKFQLLHQDQ